MVDPAEISGRAASPSATSSDTLLVKIVETGFMGGQAMAAGNVDVVGDGVYWNTVPRYNIAYLPLEGLTVARRPATTVAMAPNVYCQRNSSAR
jgi:hypothetical protein